MKPPERASAFESATVDLVPAVMLYRRAVAMAERAEQRAAHFAERESSERRVRMVDAVMETIILSQAAAEGWIYVAYRLPPRHRKAVAGANVGPRRQR